MIHRSEVCVVGACAYVCGARFQCSPVWLSPHTMVRCKNSDTNWNRESRERGRQVEMETPPRSDIERMRAYQADMEAGAIASPMFAEALARVAQQERPKKKQKRENRSHKQRVLCICFLFASLSSCVSFMNGRSPSEQADGYKSHPNVHRRKKSQRGAKVWHKCIH